MALAFVNSLAWPSTPGASSPQTSGSYTPGNGNQLIGFHFDFQAQTTWAMSGSSLGSFTSQDSLHPDTPGNDVTVFTATGNGASQTFQVSASGGTLSDLLGLMVEYSGSTAIGTYSHVNNTSTANPAGNAVSVPSGSWLVALFYANNVSSASFGSTSGTADFTDTGSTSTYPRQIVHFAGTGGSITPSLSGATNTTWDVFQFILTGPSPGPTINTQPANQYANIGSTATFTVSATTSGGALSYQWQQYTTSGWSNVGTNSSSYTTGTLAFADDGAFFQVIVTDNNGSTTSTTAFVSVTSTSAVSWWKS